MFEFTIYGPFMGQRRLLHYRRSLKEKVIETHNTCAIGGCLKLLREKLLLTQVKLLAWLLT